MNRGFRHIARAGLLAAYISVGVLGQLQSLVLLGNLWQIITANPQQQPVASVVYAPQQKHIPGAERVCVPDAGVLVDLVFPHSPALHIRFLPTSLPNLLCILVSGDSPRAPPVV